MRLGRLAVLLGAVLVVVFPSTASGAVTVGSNLASVPNNSICAPVSATPLSCTTALAFLPPANREAGGYKAGVNGVIVSWSVRTGPSTVDHTVRLRVIRGTTGAGTGELETLPKTAGVYAYPARLPIGVEDLIGIDTLNVLQGFPVPIIRTSAGPTLDYWNALLADGETREPTTNEFAAELLMNATIEPDADGDGFGDETQDQCPSSADTQGTCPPAGGGGGTGGGSTTTPPPPAVAPETILGKKPAGTIHARKATFRFNANIAGSTFQCKLDKKPFRSCKSPKTYKGLSEGKHTFKVRAIGPTGLVDPTPGKRTFKVEL
jgi:hypothetical protein